MVSFNAAAVRPKALKIVASIWRLSPASVIGSFVAIGIDRRRRSQSGRGGALHRPPQRFDSAINMGQAAPSEREKGVPGL